MERGDRKKERGRGGAAYLVKGMGDLETEEIIDTEIKIGLGNEEILDRDLGCESRQTQAPGDERVLPRWVDWGKVISIRIRDTKISGIPSVPCLEHLSRYSSRRLDLARIHAPEQESAS
jgi:hypothetical protein